MPSPPSLSGWSWAMTGLPASAQYAHVILNSPHTSPLQPRERLQLDTASQMQPRHSSLTGPCWVCCCPGNKRKHFSDALKNVSFSWENSNFVEYNHRVQDYGNTVLQKSYLTCWLQVANRWICKQCSLPSAVLIFMKNSCLEELETFFYMYRMLWLGCEYVKWSPLVSSLQKQYVTISISE
jgi:hypothetical protein